MRRRAVRNGDPTTTGGVVIAVTSTMFNHGKQVAVDGDKATCGNCDGAFPIVGGAQRMTHRGRCVALEGDAVLCPCGQNRLIAGSGSTIFYGGSGSGNAANPFAAGSALATTRDAPAPGVHDEQYVLRDSDSGQPLANVRYRILLSSGKVFTGATDATGHTLRVTSTYAESLKFEIARNTNAESR
ncbi:PAAR domain-containing protein [Burkholderia cenocepacia]|uniref:PAAR domain-containing protein n=1 Tax=Burkholderia cenocepacia TaxID=95486 RepID=UPI002238E75C|nr:PAAR domain-containing protein [Burkholderia cenocepacia]MCW5118012.1 PAAR domain-containing protein [Burkholderia cenocepacia]MCW5129845.1 PAAR domain-containing protein [Burkholderia cenocepacia]MCW5173540.1 PAAR domain-containing protein [Burkholderia cenocepacia]